MTNSSVTDIFTGNQVKLFNKKWSATNYNVSFIWQFTNHTFKTINTKCYGADVNLTNRRTSRHATCQIDIYCEIYMYLRIIEIHNRFHQPCWLVTAISNCRPSQAHASKRRWTEPTSLFTLIYIRGYKKWWSHWTNGVITTVLIKTLIA